MFQTVNKQTSMSNVRWYNLIVVVIQLSVIWMTSLLNEFHVLALGDFFIALMTSSVLSNNYLLNEQCGMAGNNYLANQFEIGW